MTDWGRVDNARSTPDQPHMEKARVSSGFSLEESCRHCDYGNSCSRLEWEVK